MRLLRSARAHRSPHASLLGCDLSPGAGRGRGDHLNVPTALGSRGGGCNPSIPQPGVSFSPGRWQRVTRCSQRWSSSGQGQVGSFWTAGWRPGAEPRGLSLLTTALGWGRLGQKAWVGLRAMPDPAMPHLGRTGGPAPRGSHKRPPPQPTAVLSGSPSCLLSSGQTWCRSGSWAAPNGQQRAPLPKMLVLFFLVPCPGLSGRERTVPRLRCPLWVPRDRGFT